MAGQFLRNFVGHGGPVEMESCNAVLLEEACGHQWAGDEILVIFPLERLRCRRNLCEKPLRGLPVHASSHAQHLYADLGLKLGRLRPTSAHGSSITRL